MPKVRRAAGWKQDEFFAHTDPLTQLQNNKKYSGSPSSRCGLFTSFFSLPLWSVDKSIRPAAAQAGGESVSWLGASTAKFSMKRAQDATSCIALTLTSGQQWGELVSCTVYSCGSSISQVQGAFIELEVYEVHRCWGMLVLTCCNLMKSGILLSYTSIFVFQEQFSSPRQAQVRAMNNLKAMSSKIIPFTSLHFNFMAS